MQAASGQRGYSLLRTVVSIGLATSAFLTFLPFLLGLGEKYEIQKLGLIQKLLVGKLSYLQLQARYRNMFSAYIILYGEGDGYFLNRNTITRQRFAYSRRGFGNFKVRGPTTLYFAACGAANKRADYTLAHRSLPLNARRINVQPVTGLIVEETAR